MNGRELHWLTTISVVRHIQTLLPRSINIKGPLAPLVNHLKRNMVFVQSRTWDKGKILSPHHLLCGRYVLRRQRVHVGESSVNLPGIFERKPAHATSDEMQHINDWKCTEPREPRWNKLNPPTPPPPQSRSCLAKAEPKLIVLAPDKQTLRGYVIFRKLKVQLQ